MINQEKVKIMTDLARYEQNQGKRDLKITEYYRKDYRAMFNLASFIWGTAGYGALILIGFLFCGNQILQDDFSTNYIAMIGLILLIGYIGFLLIYLIISGHIAGVWYDDAEDRAFAYRKNLTKLLKWYKNQSKK